MSNTASASKKQKISTEESQPINQAEAHAEGLVELARKKAMEAVEAAEHTIEPYLENIPPMLENAKHKAAELYEMASEAAGSAVQEIEKDAAFMYEKSKEIASEAYHTGIESVFGNEQEPSEVLREKVDELKQNATDLKDTAAETATAAKETVQQKASQAISAGQQKASEAISAGQQKASEVINAGQQKVEGVRHTMAEKTAEMKNAGKSTYADAVRNKDAAIQGAQDTLERGKSSAM